MLSKGSIADELTYPFKTPEEIDFSLFLSALAVLDYSLSSLTHPHSPYSFNLGLKSSSAPSYLEAYGHVEGAGLHRYTEK